jgi:hypothetical protein
MGGQVALLTAIRKSPYLRQSHAGEETFISHASVGEHRHYPFFSFLH